MVLPRKVAVVVRKGIPDDLIVAMFQEHLGKDADPLHDQMTITEQELVTFARDLLAISVQAIEAETVCELG